MGLCSPILDPVDRRCAPAHVFTARGVQWLALDRPLRCAVASDAERSAALVHRLSANTALDQGWRLRSHRTRPACPAARGVWPQRAAFGHDHSRTLQSSPESGGRAGYDGAKRRKGSKVHAAVDTLGHLLALHVTPANEQDRAQVGQLAEKVQEVTGQSVELAYVDQGSLASSLRKTPPLMACNWK
jgi:hypothetical protein